MRAKTVNFERGIDPKDSLQIGNAKLRKFKEDLRSKNFLAPYDNLVDLLEEGFISDKDAEEFIIGGVKEYAPKHYRLSEESEWVEAFLKTNNIYWSKFDESLNINFVLPNLKRINTWIGKISTAEGHIVFRMKTGSYSPEGNDYDIKEANIFYYNDEVFCVKYLLKQIDRVVSSTNINIG